MLTAQSALGSELCAIHGSTDAAKLELARAETVLVGRVSRLDYRVQAVDHVWTLATFESERVFKGQPARSVPVFINAGPQIGDRLLVFARQDERNARIQSLVDARVVGAFPLRSASSLSELPQLAADGACAGSAFVLREGSTGADYLRALEQLPPPGQGGELALETDWLPIGDADQGRRVCLSKAEGKETAELFVVGAQLRQGLKLDWRLRAPAQACDRLVLGPLPEGRYRLEAKPMPGYRLRCDKWGRDSCDRISVADRGLTESRLSIEPDAELRIQLHDQQALPAAAAPWLMLRRLDAPGHALPFALPRELLTQPGFYPLRLPSGRYALDLIDVAPETTSAGPSAERGKPSRRKTLIEKLELKPGDEQRLLLRLP